jgi:hypothetical protein
MIMDFMGTMVAFDTRLIRTLKAILFQPGKLTLDFVNGKRAPYMPPFRFYVFVSFVMFLLISHLTSESIQENRRGKVGNTLKGETVITDSLAVIQDSILAKVNKELEGKLDSSVVGTGFQFSQAGDLLDQVSKEADSEDNKYLAQGKKIADYPELYTDKVFQFLSWGLFVLMPVFAFFLWMFFRRTRPLFVGHLIFSLNIHSFIFTIAVIVLLLVVCFPGRATHPEGYLFWLVPVYQLIGARKLYKRTWVKSFFKLLLIWVCYSFVLLIVGVIIASLAFFNI